jgi:hypothetical protein
MRLLARCALAAIAVVVVTALLGLFIAMCA